MLERDGEVMTDRDFQIQKELHLHFCRLFVPPAARGKSQMTKSEVKNTKVSNKFANSCWNNDKQYKIFQNFKRNQTSDNDATFRWYNIKLCCIMQFEAKTYKIQKTGFPEVTGNFYYKFAD